MDKCRICLNSNFEDGHGIFDSEKDNVPISNHIMSIADIYLNQEDDFPQVICPKCFSELEVAIQFKTKCELNDKLLKSAVIKNELPEDAEDDVKKEELYSDTEDASFTLLPNSDYPMEKDDNVKIEVQAQHNKKTKFLCNACGAHFARKKKLSAHIKNNCFSKYLCQICKKLFVKEVTLHNHIRNFHKDSKNNYIADENMFIEGVGKGRQFCCKKCDYKTSRHIHMRIHVRTHTGARPFKCDICAKAYSQPGALAQHKLQHTTANTMFPCDKCGKVYKFKYLLLKHIRKVHSDRKFECELCGKQLKSKATLAEHMTRHNGDKNFSCELCAAAFFTLSQLCNHRNTHKGLVKRFKCTICDYRSSRKSTLNMHISRHSNDRPFSCSECGRMFETAIALNVHNKRHTPSMKLQCPLCVSMCCDLNTLRKHIKRKHNLSYTLKTLQTVCEDNSVKNKVDEIATYYAQPNVVK